MYVGKMKHAVKKLYLLVLLRSLSAQSYIWLYVVILLIQMHYNVLNKVDFDHVRSGLCN